MIAAYKRKATIATVVFVGGIVGAVALVSAHGYKKNLWDDAPLGPILGVTFTVSFYLAFWWYLRAKGRSGAWMLMLFLGPLGVLVMLLLKDRGQDGQKAR
jgi:fluoride ion exporter CrcB/FEX